MYKKSYFKYVDWFCNYVDSFYTGEELYDYNIRLKRLHTFRVISNSFNLAETIGLPQNDKYLAGIVALFHDLGRFEQLKKYSSFIDAQTEDHALMAKNILIDKNILDDEIEKEVVIFSVEHHNKLVLPNTDNRIELFAKIVRDSDKTDIMRVMVDQYSNIDSPQVKVALHRLKDDGSISQNVIDSLINRTLVSRSDIKGVTDYLCHILSWVYDLYFPQTIDLMKQGRVIYKLLDFLPDTDDGNKIKNILINEINLINL